MSGRALPEQQAVLRVEHDKPAAARAEHCSALDQHLSSRTFQNAHMAKFQQIFTSIGVHVVQAMLHLLSEGDSCSSCFAYLIYGQDRLVLRAVRWEALRLVSSFPAPLISGQLCAQHLGPGQAAGKPSQSEAGVARGC